MKQSKLQKLQQMQGISDIGLVDVSPSDDSLLQRKTRKRHHHRYHYDPLNLAQKSSTDSQKDNKTHAIYYKGKVKIVPDHQVKHLEKNTLAKPSIFVILSLDPSDKGTFKQKTYNRTHLSEMFEIYDDVTQIRKDDPFVIMVGNGKLIKHTGSIEQDEIQALIGRAIQKKFLSIKFGKEELAQTKTESKTVSLIKITEEDGKIQTTQDTKTKESLKKVQA